MTAKTSFTPDPTIQPYNYNEHYLKIEDTKGTTLFTKTFETKESLQQEFESIKKSKKPYSYLYRTVFPSRCDTITNFFKSLFVPNTLAIIASSSSLNNRVAQVALSIIPFIFDMMTLPIRLITAIPYVIYDKCFNKEKDHKIISLISNNPDALYALSKGKVIVRQITEDFSHIQPGTINDKAVYQLKGSVFRDYSDVYIKRTLSAGGINESYSANSKSVEGIFIRNLEFNAII